MTPIFRFLLVACMLNHATSQDIPSLTAIQLRSALSKRDVDFTPNLHCENFYVDHQPLLLSQSARFAKVSMHLKVPAIALEDIEYHIESVSCVGTSIKLKFHDENVLQKVKKEWEQQAKFLVITSHEGCNPRGARTPHLVWIVDHPADRSLTLSVAPLEWNDVYDFLNVEIGMTAGSDDFTFEGLRHHGLLRRNQKEKRVATSTLVKEDPTLWPSLPPTTIPTNTVAHYPFAYTPPPPKQELTPGGEVMCNNCSIQGTIDLTDANFNKSSFDKATFTTTASNFSAHVEIEAKMDPFVPIKFSAGLKTFTFSEFGIPKIANIRPSLFVEVFGILVVSSAIDLVWGFDAKIPDGSSVKLNMSDIQSTSYTGFDQISVKSIPFTANVSQISIKSLTIGLRNNFLFSVNAIGGEEIIEAGIFFDIPAVEASFSMASGLNSVCANATGSDYAFSELLHLQPTAIVSIGALVSASGAPLVAAAFNRLNGLHTKTPVNLPTTLPTACLSWNSQKSAFVAPTVPTSATTSSTVKATTTSQSPTTGLDSKTISATTTPTTTGRNIVASPKASGASSVVALVGGEGFSWTIGALAAVALLLSFL